MNTQTILVTLKRNDAVEEILPYVEKVAKAGTKVVFILQYPAESSLFPAGYWVTTESVKEAVEAGKDLMRRSSWAVQKSLAEARVAPARTVLEQLGAEVSVELSAGRLKTAVKKFTADSDTGALLMHLAPKSPLAMFLRKMLGFFRALGGSPIPPRILLQLHAESTEALNRRYSMKPGS